jgi:ABC-type transporter Mla subunit MlaD
MSIRVGRSFADLINALEQITAGLNKAGNDSKQKAYAKSLGGYLTVLRKLDEQQEKAKAELHRVSKELKKNDTEVRALLGKVISYLESEYGKSAPELQQYGIARRQPGGKREPRAKKQGV